MKFLLIFRPNYNWLVEEDSKFVSLQKSRNERKLLEIKEELRLLKASANAKKTSKSSRSRKQASVDVMSTNFPWVLGRGIHRTVVMQIGELPSGDAFRSDVFFYPVGFKSRRKYYNFDYDPDVSETTTKVNFQCSISEENGLPMVCMV